MVLLAVSAALFWNTADNIETFSGGEADIFVAPKPHTLTKAERVAVGSVAKQFVESAVARDHPERAYEIVNADLRGGLTRKQWAKGEIPVVPYPVARVIWKVEYSNTDAVGLAVKIYPTKAAQLEPTVFSMSLVPIRVGDDNRWLVSSWAPRAGSPSAIGGPSRGGGASQDAERISPTASVLWLLVPVVLICLVFVIPVVFLLRERRIARRMRRQLDSRSL
jgi:hypothetical protein